MKNRKTLYVLIPLVGVIWGLIAWRILDYQPDDVTDNYQVDTTEERYVTDTSRYVLRFGYNDPFLRSSVRSRSSITSKDKVKDNNIKQVDISNMTQVNRPVNLVYRGEIKGYRYKVGLLEIEGSKVLVSEESVVGEYSIVSVSNDSLIISYRDKRFTYGKQ